MSEIAIEVDGVWKKFRRGELHDSLRDALPALGRRLLGRRPSNSQLTGHEFWALRNVSFELKRGEALGVIGPNGAGKSTLLKILSRILRPNRGHYRVNGRLRALIEVAAGFHSDLTGRENIYLNGAILGMGKREIDRKLDEIIDFSGIEQFVDTPIKRFSSGMQARLGFSIAAHMDPEILLVDEVLSVGDVAFRSKCIRHMEQLVRSGVSVIFISHVLDQVRRLCNSCVVLNHGTVYFAGDVEPACEAYYEAANATDDRAPDTNGNCREGGSIIGLTIEDAVHGGKAVRAHEPVRLLVSYTLQVPMSAIGLVVAFNTSDGRYLTNCNTEKDDVRNLPSEAGTHTVALNLDGIPFSDGQYLLSVRLLDAASGGTLDYQHWRYPIRVLGVPDADFPVQLRRAWSVEDAVVAHGDR